MAIAAEELAGGAEASAGRAEVDSKLSAARARMPKPSEFHTHTKSLRKPPPSTKESRAAERDYDAGGGKTISEGRYRAQRAASATGKAAKSAGGTTVRAARSAGGSAASIKLPSMGGGMLGRVVFAFGAGLLALELASYLSGRYFNWNIKTGASKVNQAAQVLELYPGQAAKLAALSSPPAKTATAASSYAGTATLV